MLRAVQAVQSFQDSKRRLPVGHKQTFFSKYDLWRYISISDKRRCWYCERLDGLDFRGDELRRMFPDLVRRSDNVLDVHVHKTLWNKDTCRCKLVRTEWHYTPRYIESSEIRAREQPIITVTGEE